MELSTVQSRAENACGDQIWPVPVSALQFFMLHQWGSITKSQRGVQSSLASMVYAETVARTLESEYDQYAAALRIGPGQAYIASTSYHAW